MNRPMTQRQHLEVIKSLFVHAHRKRAYRNPADVHAGVEALNALESLVGWAEAAEAAARKAQQAAQPAPAAPVEN